MEMQDPSNRSVGKARQGYSSKSITLFCRLGRRKVPLTPAFTYGGLGGTDSTWTLCEVQIFPHGPKQEDIRRLASN